MNAQLIQVIIKIIPYFIRHGLIYILKESLQITCRKPGMDIEQNDNNNNQNMQQNSPTKSNHAYMRQSIKSRMSNQSMISIPQPKNYPERISFQSNISEKLRQQQNQKGLFDQLICNDLDNNQVRTYGSNPNDYKFNRISEENRNESINQSSMAIEQSNQSIEQFITQEKIICKCSKSKCLLMYCQCFSKGLVCNQQCSCYQCRNNSQFQQKRQKARQSVLERDPNAFTNKLEMVGGEQTQLAHKRGCNCKKTHCFKKYCECFHAGVKCTYLCHCQGCLNGGQNALKE